MTSRNEETLRITLSLGLKFIDKGIRRALNDKDWKVREDAEKALALQLAGAIGKAFVVEGFEPQPMKGGVAIDWTSKPAAE